MKANETSPLWYIAGIGAVGTLLAGYFCAGKHQVRLVLKDGNQLATYKTTSLTVVNDQNSITCNPQAISLEQLGHAPIDYLLCCVKAYDVTSLLMRLKANLNAHSTIILIHNGLGVLDEIKAKLPQLRIIFGLSTLGSYLEHPFSVRAFLDGNIYLGTGTGQFTSNEINTICHAFQASHLPYQWEENIFPRMWEKFAINCSINLLTALLKCTNGGLRQYDEMLKKITHEITTVLNAYGFYMTANELLTTVNQVIQFTANNFSSMYKDVHNKKPTELKYLNEHLVKLARQKKLFLPFNEQLLNQFYEKFP